VNISTNIQTIAIQTDLDACYTVEIISSTGEAVYKGDIWSHNQNITITGLEHGEYDVSVALITQEFKKHITLTNH